MSTTGQGIHTGYWIDHSKGVVLGGTLTYRQNVGSQLISAATIMVSLIGASVWAISAFFLHQDGVNRGLQDEYDAQKQVILRNGSSPVGTVVAYYNMGRTWHNRARNAWRRSIIHMLPPTLIFVAFTIAGIFVGQIAENPYDSRVLLKSDSCGTVIVNASSTAAQIKFAQLYSNISQISEAYARACYARSTSDSISCSSYATPSIAYTKLSNATCPLGEGNCELRGGSQPLTLQALRIDSHDDFGINAPVSERVQLGYQTTCAPVSHTLIDDLTVEDFSDGIRDRYSNYSSMQLRIGADISNGFPVAYNYTQVVRDWGIGITGYSVRPFTSKYPHNGYGSWLPVSPFNQTETDMTIYVIAANGILYATPNRDPIFQTFSEPLPGDSRFYGSDGYFHAMVCSETYSICKDSGNTCTPWVAQRLISDEVDKLQLDPRQNATWYRIAEAIINADMSLATATTSSLRASDYLLAGAPTSAGVPENQWEAEAEGFFQAVLSRMQYITQSFASLPSYILDQADEVGIIVEGPDSPELLAQCTNQRIQTPPGYTSYNVFALVFIFVVALIAIGIGIFISGYGHKLPGRHPGGPNYYKLISYQADGMLQLQRMAFEGAGLGGWRSGTGARKDIPYTEHGTARVPPPIVETKISSRANTQQFSADTDDTAEQGYDDGLLHYEKVVPDDDSDEPRK